MKRAPYRDGRTRAYHCVLFLVGQRLNSHGPSKQIDFIVPACGEIPDVVFFVRFGISRQNGWADNAIRERLNDNISQIVVVEKAALWIQKLTRELTFIEGFFEKMDAPAESFVVLETSRVIV